MQIPAYPEAAPINLSMRGELHPDLAMLPDGVSEYTFAGLYLFRDTYHYRLSRLPNDRLLVSGWKDGKAFCMAPCGLPPDHALVGELFDRYDYLKGLSERYAEEARSILESLGVQSREDRDNFDYLYNREDLATLSGRKFHKKRNHVNAFIKRYESTEHDLRTDNVGEALDILEAWQSKQEDRADYAAAREGLNRYRELGLRGYMVRVDGTAVAYSLGEPIMRGRAFVIHFEKAIDEYRGVYQFINKAFAARLPSYVRWINREQDLGEEGMRQSKMTYRPAGFVKKYRVGRDLPVPKETDSDVARANQASA